MDRYVDHKKDVTLVTGSMEPSLCEAGSEQENYLRARLSDCDL